MSICENDGLREVQAPLPGVSIVFLEGKAQDLCDLPLVLQGSSSSICETEGVREVQAPLPGVPGVFPEGSFSFICENDGLWDVQASLPGVSSVLFGGFVIFHWFYKVHLPPSVRMVD